jgi:hypothetical protein
VNPRTLRSRDFYAAVRPVSEGDLNHAAVLADWLDEHDDPIRAHIFRHGVRQHQVADRGADVTKTWVPHRAGMDVGQIPVPSSVSVPGVIFKDEGRQVRRLRGDSVVGPGARTPLAQYENGPERWELWRAEPLSDPVSSGGPGDRYAVRYTLRLGRRTLRLVAPVTEEHVRAIQAAIPEPEHESGPLSPTNGRPSGEGYDWWMAANRMRWNDHQDRPVPLSRVARIGPAIPAYHHNPIGDGSATVRENAAIHHFFDEQGQRAGSIKVVPRDDGKTLHVAWIGRPPGSDGSNSLGPKAIRSLHALVAEHYPDATHFSGLRVSGFRTDKPVDQQEVRIPIRRARKLARKVFRAPTGGTVVNHQYQRGGQFLAKARQRIRDVASRLVKLARADGKTRATDLVGRGAEYDTPLTLGQLKAIEDLHELPRSRRLSPKATQPLARTGDEHPYSVSIDDAIKFAGHLSRSAIGPGRLKKALLSSDDPERHVHLTTQLLGDYEDAPHGAWYGDDVNVLDRLLHGRFGFGKLDANGELVGKGAPHENHPELVLFKTLVGMTSPAANPLDNARSAISMWAAGERRAKAAGSDDPLAHIPPFQDEYLRDWMQRLAGLNGVESVPNPGTTPTEKAKWYATWVHPHAAALGLGKGQTDKVGYTANAAKIYVGKGHQHDGVVYWDDKNGYNPAAPTPSRTKARLIDVKLPGTDASGAIRPKGWSTYGTNTARALNRLKKLVDGFRTPHGGTREAYRKAAEWLFNFHPAEEFSEADRRSVFSGGFYSRSERAPGFYIFGPKVGAFITNLHANDPATRESHGEPFTHDTWMHRQLLRHLGRLTDDAGSKSPTSGDRRVVRDVVTTLAKKLGITAAELQADLWYYEQGLMRRLGVPGHRIQSLSFRQAAEKFLDPNSPHRLARTEGMNQHEQGAQHNADDATAWEALADHYEENSEPGANFLREHAKHLRDKHPLLGSHAGPARSERDRTLSNARVSGLYSQHLPFSPEHSGFQILVRSPHAEFRRLDHYWPRVVAVMHLSNGFPLHVSATPENVERLASDMGVEGDILRRSVATAYTGPGGPVPLSRPNVHGSLLASLGGKTWKRHTKRVAVQKNKDNSISVFVHGRRIVTAHPDGTVRKHDAKVRLSRTLPSTGDLVTMWNQIRHDPRTVNIDHTAASILADYLEENDDWRHHLLRRTAQRRGEHIYPIGYGLERPDGLAAAGKYAEPFGYDRGTKDVHSPVGVYHVSPMAGDLIGVTSRMGYPLNPDPVYSLMKPDEYEAMRADAKTAGVHFPEAPSGPIKLSREDDHHNLIAGTGGDILSAPLDAHTLGVLADFLEEHGLPGANAAREGFDQQQRGVPGEYERTGPHSYYSDIPGVPSGWGFDQDGERPAVFSHEAPGKSEELERRFHQPGGMIAEVYRAQAGHPVLGLSYRSPKYRQGSAENDTARFRIHLRSREQLHRVTEDLPAPMRKALRKHLEPHLA